MALGTLTSFRDTELLPTKSQLGDLRRFLQHAVATLVNQRLLSAPNATHALYTCLTV